MREIHTDEIILTVRQLCIDANIEIRPDTIEAYHNALKIEESEVGREVLFYVGPSPAPPGKVIGAAGPTTAGRMDAFTPMLIERGLLAMIGKGRRSEEVRAAMLEHGCIYFGSVEGTAALLSECIRCAEIVTYEDLGPEAIYRLTVENFPAIVVNDLHGGDLYEEGRKQYRRSWPG